MKCQTPSPPHFICTFAYLHICTLLPYLLACNLKWELYGKHQNIFLLQEQPEHSIAVYDAAVLVMPVYCRLERAQ